MDLRVNKGRTIRLPAEFLSGGMPTDPIKTIVKILDPSGTAVETGIKPVRERVGIYHVDYSVPQDAPLGTWQVVWEAVVNGKQVSGDDPFEVLPGEPGTSARPPAADPPAASQPRTVLAPPATPGVKPPSASPPPARPPASVPRPPAAAAPGKAPGSAPARGKVPDSARLPVSAPPPGKARGSAGARPAATPAQKASIPPPVRPPASTPKPPPARAPQPAAPAAAPRGSGPPPPTPPPPAPASFAAGGKTRKPSKRPAPAPSGRIPRRPEDADDPSVFVITAPRTAGERAEEELEHKQNRTRTFRRRRLKIGLGILGVAALGFALFMTFQLNQDATYEAAFAQAEKAISEGNLEGARVVYRDILQQDPANKFAHFNLGMLAHMQGRGAEAEDFYRRALREDSTFLAPLFNLAILQEALGRDQEAAQTYREILDEYPDDAASHFNYGSLLIRKLGDTEEGQKQIDRAVELDSSLSARVSPGPPDPGEPVASPQSEE